MATEPDGTTLVGFPPAPRTWQVNIGWHRPASLSVASGPTMQNQKSPKGPQSPAQGRRPRSGHRPWVHPPPLPCDLKGRHRKSSCPCRPPRTCVASLGHVLMVDHSPPLPPTQRPLTQRRESPDSDLPAVDSQGHFHLPDQPADMAKSVDAPDLKSVGG